jgi:uncharacterized protein
MIDSHTHLLPDALAKKIRAFFDQGMPTRLSYPLDHGIVLDRLSAAGINTVWSLPYAHKPSVGHGMNVSLAEIARTSHSVNIINGSTVHPGDDDPLAVVRHAVEDLGSRVLKLHCSVGSFGVDDPALDPVWEYSSAHHLPVVIHAGHGTHGFTEVDELDPIALVADRYPDAVIIIAHCGHRAAAKALDIIEARTSVYADLTPVVREPVALPPGRAQALSHKLLFGTDAPNTVVTAEQALDHLRAQDLTSEAWDAITHNNAERLVAAVR